MLEPPALTPEQAAALVDRLSENLERMMNLSCAEMGPLWLAATRQQRKPLGQAESMALPFEPSKRFFALSKGVRSKYRALATWRHCCLMQDAIEQLEDAEFRSAMVAVYFTPYPADTPPYAWSSRASAAPAVAEFPSPTSLKHQAKEGCHETVLLLMGAEAELRSSGSWHDEVRAGLVGTGCRKTVRDVLKLEDLMSVEPT
jgi:hypothetical protein